MVIRENDYSLYRHWTRFLWRRSVEYNISLCMCLACCVNVFKISLELLIWLCQMKIGRVTTTTES